MTTSQISEVQLTLMLRDLIAGAGWNGELDPAAFWHFVAALAQGRGITETLHQEGLAAAAEAPSSPARTYNERQRRAYHIGLLLKFLTDVGGLPGQPSVFPQNFSHGAVASDLSSMLGGKSGLGSSRPQILNSVREGQNTLRQHARRLLVGAVLWRVAQSGRPIAEVREKSLADVDKPLWDKWLREFGGASGTLALTARADGKAGNALSPFALSDEKIKALLVLLEGSQGRRRKG